MTIGHDYTSDFLERDDASDQFARSLLAEDRSGGDGEYCACGKWVVQKPCRRCQDMRGKDRAALIRYVAERTETLGGGKKSTWGNPLAVAMEDKPPVFALGVDVGEVIDLVVQGMNELPGDFGLQRTKSGATQ